MNTRAGALLVWTALALLAPCARAEPERTVRLTNGEWPPYLSASLEQQGVLSRIVVEAFRLRGMRVEYGFYPWPRALVLARSEDYEGSVAWLKNPERERDFYFSEPVMDTEYVLYHLKNRRMNWSNVDDLARYRIGVSLGYYYGKDFADAVDSGRLKVSSVPKDELNVRKLLVGRIDVFPMDKRVARYLFQEKFSDADIARLTYDPKPLSSQPLYLILARNKPGNEALMAEFNKGLHTLRANGQLEQLLK